MANDNPDVGLWLKAIDRELLIYYWHCRYLGHDIDENKIEQLEKEVYTEEAEGVDKSVLWKRDIDELQLLLSLGDPEPEMSQAFVIKKRFYSLK